MYPMHHLLWHLIDNIRRNGNPSFYHTYADEGENSIIGQVSMSVRGKTYYKSLFIMLFAEFLCRTACLRYLSFALFFLSYTLLELLKMPI